MPIIVATAQAGVGPVPLLNIGQSTVAMWPGPGESSVWVPGQQLAGRLFVHPPLAGVGSFSPWQGEVLRNL